MMCKSSMRECAKGVSVDLGRRQLNVGRKVFQMVGLRVRRGIR
jgi:hypothetical protein